MKKKEDLMHTLLKWPVAQRMTWLPLVMTIYGLMVKKSKVVIAIDGRCGSGKSTLAGLLGDLFDAQVYPMDDFYLTPDQRTEERLKTPGGNVAYERVLDEILMPLFQGTLKSYQAYGCQTGSFKQVPVDQTKSLHVVEGAYSMHPSLRSYYDLTIMLSLPKALQEDRIKNRNGLEGWDRFKRLWIPLEESYLDHYDIAGQANLCLDPFFESIRQNATPDAVMMKKYMKNQFDFLGIKTPLRKKLQKEWLKASQALGFIDWQVVETLWDQPEREFQYMAIDYLKALSSDLGPHDDEKIKDLILRKSWWDTVDGLGVFVMGAWTKRHRDRAEIVMLAWANSDELWLNRAALIHQVTDKTGEGFALLEKIISATKDKRTFFINKGMGWALRAHSKNYPEWVRGILEKYDLSPLTVREASKYLDC